MKQQYQTRYELLHESYQKWLTYRYGSATAIPPFIS